MNERENLERVESLLRHMTSQEKVAQMIQVPCNMVTGPEAKMWAARGAGSFLHAWGDKAHELQRIACATRMGIPALFGIDAIHGHCLNEHATIFPSQLAAACTWDPDLLRQMGHAVAREVAADGVHWTFSPVLCLARDPRWGRVDETFGEDPYLAGELGAAIIKGYQGNDLSAEDSILACAKHYIAYGEAVGARDSYDSEVTFRKVREVFLPPFRKAVQAGCATFMTAYGSLDGTPCTLHKKLLKSVLRDELGFDGLVVTDWDNVRNLVDKQRVCKDMEDASVQTAESGNDMIMTSLDFYDAALRMLNNGHLDEQVIDDAVRHILMVKLRMGLMENPDKSGNKAWIGCAEHQRLALQMAENSLVLLRNDGTLPIKVKSVAIIGANADDVLAQYGDWTYFSHPDQHIDRDGIRPYVTLREGMEALGRERGIEMTYAKGCAVLPSPDDDVAIQDAVACAEKSEMIVYAIGDRYELLGEGRDRANLDLTGRQKELYEALQSLNKPICVVVITSKPLCLGTIAETSNALLIAFNGGLYGGQAIAEALLGITNPCGKLPISFPRHSGQLPVYYNALPGWHGGKYVDLPGRPQFAFGDGISYTDFSLSAASFDIQTYLLSMNVQNVGERTGSTVVQVYFRDCVSSVMVPEKQLIAFKRVTLQAHEESHVVLQLAREDFSLVNAEEQRVTEPGDFILMVGTSSHDCDMMEIPFNLI